MFPVPGALLISALLAAGLDLAGLALVAAAGLLWAAGLYLCLIAPVVVGRHGRSVNEAVASTLTTIAAVMVLVGAVSALLEL